MPGIVADLQKKDQWSFNYLIEKFKVVVTESIIVPMNKLNREVKLRKIASYTSKRLAAKLEKIMNFDYEEEFRKKYLSQGISVKERVAQKAAEQLKMAELALHERITLSQKSKDRYEAINWLAGTKITSEEFPGIWFIDKTGQLFQLKDQELNQLQKRVVASLKRCMPLFGIETMVIATFPYDKNTIAMSACAAALPCLLYNDNFVTKRSDDSLNAYMAHECAHATFRHNMRQAHFLPEYSSCPEGYHILRYYKEKQANVHAALTFPREQETLAWRMLNAVLSNYSALSFADNDPIKGQANDDEHPSWLQMYIQAFKIRNLLEAEQRWVASEEANERYGSVYYDRAWQKWAEQQTDGAIETKSKKETVCI